MIGLNRAAFCLARTAAHGGARSSLVGRPGAIGISIGLGCPKFVGAGATLVATRAYRKSDVTVVTSDLLKDHDAAEPAEPEVAATAPAESEPQRWAPANRSAPTHLPDAARQLERSKMVTVRRFQNDDLILDELDNYPSRPVLDGKSARPLAARDANPGRSPASRPPAPVRPIAFPAASVCPARRLSLCL